MRRGGWAAHHLLHEGEVLPLWHTLQLDLVIVRAVGRHQCPGMLKVLALGETCERAHASVVEPARDEDAPIARGQRIVLPLLEIAIVLEPLVLLLAHVDLDLAAHAAIDRLHLT